MGMGYKTSNFLLLPRKLSTNTLNKKLVEVSHMGIKAKWLTNDDPPLIPIWPTLTNFFPSRVSGRGYKIGPVSVCVSVCLSVSEHSHGRTVWPSIMKFGVSTDLNNLLAKFDGQGHRSKVKVTMLENMIF